MSALGAWARDVAVRAVKTAAQTTVAALAAQNAGVLPSVLTLQADLKLGGLAAVVCVLHNIAGLQTSSSPTATLEQTVEPVTPVEPVAAPATTVVHIAPMAPDAPRADLPVQPSGPTVAGTAPAAEQPQA